jgi:hypothetical protein
MMVDMFDTIGTLIGAADKAGYLDENGNLPKIERAMLADALATTSGAVFGTSTVSTYIESTAGIAAGGKTIKTVSELRTVLSDYRYGNALVVTISRNGVTSDVTLILDEYEPSAPRTNYSNVYDL